MAQHRVEVRVEGIAMAVDKPLDEPRHLERAAEGHVFVHRPPAPLGDALPGRVPSRAVVEEVSETLASETVQLMEQTGNVAMEVRGVCGVELVTPVRPAHARQPSSDEIAGPPAGQLTVEHEFGHRDPGQTAGQPQGEQLRVDATAGVRGKDLHRVRRPVGGSQPGDVGDSPLHGRTPSVGDDRPPEARLNGRGEFRDRDGGSGH